MSTCYEYQRKKQDRIQGYLNALEQDQTEQYHNEHGRKKHGRGVV